MEEEEEEVPGGGVLVEHLPKGGTSSALDPNHIPVAPLNTFTYYYTFLKIGRSRKRRESSSHSPTPLKACVFVSSRDAPTLAITTTDLKPNLLPAREYNSVFEALQAPLTSPAHTVSPCPGNPQRRGGGLLGVVTFAAASAAEAVSILNLGQGSSLRLSNQSFTFGFTGRLPKTLRISLSYFPLVQA